MEELLNWGFNELEIKDIISRNHDILDKDTEEINKLFSILLYAKCNRKVIRHIIISNPFYLNRMEDDLFRLINKLHNIGINDLDVLFESNPFILNKDDFEIDEFIKNKISEGKSFDEIIEIIETDWF